MGYSRYNYMGFTNQLTTRLNYGVPHCMVYGISNYSYWLVVSNIFSHNIWDNPSHWLIFFKMVEATNQNIWIIQGGAAVR